MIIDTGLSAVTLSGAPADADIAKHFISDDASKKVVSTGDGTWALK